MSAAPLTWCDGHEELQMLLNVRWLAKSPLVNNYWLNSLSCQGFQAFAFKLRLFESHFLLLLFFFFFNLFRVSIQFLESLLNFPWLWNYILLCPQCSCVELLKEFKKGNWYKTMNFPFWLVANRQEKINRSQFCSVWVTIPASTDLKNMEAFIEREEPDTEKWHTER